MLTLTIGDTFQYTATITDDAGDAYDLLDCTLWFTVKRRKGDTDANATAKLYWVSGGASAGITVDDPATGEATVELTPAQTDDFVQAAYHYDLQVEDQDGDFFTIDQGVIVAQPGVTTRITTP